MSAANGNCGENGTGAQPSGLVVLGMHRSGTSVVTGVLHLCGAWAGEDGELTASNIENPLGFWERRDIRKTCDDLLHSAGADWWKVARFSPESIPHAVFSEQSRRFQAAVSELQEHGLWVVKEPRLCLLLPALHEYLNDAVCVHVFRNPLEVARSLQHRNGFGIAAGLALWELYNKRALSASRTMPRLMIDYGTLMGDPAKAVNRLVAQLGKLGVTQLAVPEESILKQFIQPRYHRHRVTEEDTEQYLSPDQRALWQQIQRGDVLTENPGETISLATAQSLYDLETSQQSVSHRTSRIKQLDATLISREKELARLRKDIDNYREELMSQEPVLASLRKDIDVRDRELAARDEELELRERELASRDKRLRDLRNSTSWKVTAPLRVLSLACRKGMSVFIRSP